MFKRMVKDVVRSGAARIIPRSRGASGRLAKDGGLPVRDTRLRPWPAPDKRGVVEWMTEVGPRLRSVYLSGNEGLPQTAAKSFASEWASRCGTRHGLMVAHGTDALRIGLAAVLDHDGLEYGGEVIVPNFSFIASATAALDRRMGVALVDVDPETLLLDPQRVEEAIVPGRTKAIVPVHLFGQPANMTALGEIADRHGLKIVEDAAQAHGAEWESGPVGSLGDAGAFSFQSSKVLNSGEGGALVTDSDDVFERAYSMHNVGRPYGREGRWDHMSLGWNCRPTEYQAELLLHRTEVFEELQERRRKNFDTLRRLLEGVECVEPLRVHPGVRKHGMYMFAMRYKPGACGDLPVDKLVEIVQLEGLPLYRAFQATLSRQPALRSLIDRRPTYFQCPDTPVADQATQETIFLPHPFFLGTARDMQDVPAVFEKVVASYG